MRQWTVSILPETLAQQGFQAFQ